jgi:ribosomal protein S14
MTIDLTGPVPQVVSSCDHCGSFGRLYRLIGTHIALCRGCFARQHG